MGSKASGRRGNGAGYGGPAKGAGNGAQKLNFGPDTNAQGHNQATPETRAAHRREQAEQLKDMLHQLALGGQSESARVQAASAFLDRVEGKPLARQEVSATVRRSIGDYSEDELAAIAGESGS